LTAAENVKVEVLDGLTAVRVRVDDDAVSGVGDSLVPGDLRRKPHQISHIDYVVRFIERRYMPSRDDQQMRRRLRIDVAKDDSFIILGNDVSGDLAAYDPAE